MNKLIDEANISREAIAWYKISKQEFENAKISFNDISRFVHCLDFFKSQSYDTGEILRKFEQYKNIDDLNDFQQTTININDKSFNRWVWNIGRIT